MPTKKKRINFIPDNLPAITTPEETCPSLFTGQKLAERDSEKYARIVGIDKSFTDLDAIIVETE